jgi:hypothetical protein
MENPPWLEEVFQIFKAARKRDFLVLDEVLQIQPSRENPVDLAHLGILLVLDKQRNGRYKTQHYHDRKTNDTCLFYWFFSYSFVPHFSFLFVGDRLAASFCC